MDNNKRTLETYEKIAEEYARMNNENVQMKKYHRLFNSYLDEGFIYDIGCGTGRDVQALSEMGYEVVGIDASKKMLEVAKKNYPNRKFVKMNLLEDVNLLNEADGLWACASLLHFDVQEFEMVFNRLIDKLKDGGIIYISLKIKNKVQSALVNGRFFQYYTKKYLDEYMQRQELDILYYEESENRNDCFANYFLRKNKKEKTSF